MDRRRNKMAGRGGFTLIELIVVVGIIVLLMALVIPALGHARTSAKVAAVKAQMEGIARACEQYHTDFNAYPGTVDDRAIDGTVAYTAAQNLYLGLTTRFYPAPPPLTPPYNITAVTVPYAGFSYGTSANPISVAPGTIYFDADPSRQMASYAVTSDHQNLSVVVTNEPNCYTFDAYLIPKAGESSTGTQFATGPTGVNLQMTPTTAPVAGAPPKIIPSFVDGAFGNLAMPILYYRRVYKWDRENASATGAPVSLGGTPFAYATSAAKSAAGGAGQACFYASTNTMIDPGKTLGVPTGQTITVNGVSTVDLDVITGNPTGGTFNATAEYQPKGEFVLVSPGPDRIYGTSDDIIVAGGQ